jgi:hypothetical protein
LNRGEQCEIDVGRLMVKCLIVEQKQFSRDLIEFGDDIRLCALKLVGFLGGAITGPREDLLAGLLS